jgi:hypothetical protein
MSNVGRARRRVNSEQRAEQAARAYEMRLQGQRLAAIGRELGIATSTVHKLLAEHVAARVDPLADAYRAMELDRLDDLTVRAYAVLTARHVVVQHGKVILDPDSGEPMLDDAPVLNAIDRLVRLSESRRKLLGLDAPLKADVTVTPVDPADIELAQIISEARAKAAVEEAALKGESR